MDCPICLIENTENDQFVVNPEAINILAKFNQPVVVVSIVGLNRTGKSYLMNRLAGAQRGFGVGFTVRAQTKGIWMWCVPHPKKRNHTLVLLDTEGLGDVEKGDGKSDIRIFTLALLLSSALVYNSKGTIDQDAMDKLKFVGEISELIKIKSDNNENEEAEFSSHFPIFIWAVRDFHLGLEIDGRTLSEDGYLENCLKLKDPERSTKDEDYNRPRKRLRMYFGTRKCYTFGSPSADEELLQNLLKAPESELNEKFVAQCQKFCDYIFSEVKVKSVRDMLEVTGPRFGDLVKIYTDAITNSKFACMEEAVVSLAERENQAAIQGAMQYFAEKMNTIPLPTETLDSFLELSRKHEDEARQIFLKRSFKDNNQQYLNQFMETLLKEKNEFSSRNEEKSLEICRAVIKKHSVNLEEALAGGTYHVRGGYAKFKQDLKAIEDKYNREQGKGVKAEEVLQEYIKSKQAAEINIIQQDNSLNMKEKKAAEENNQKKMKELEENFNRRLVEQKGHWMQENRASLEKSISQLADKMAEERRMMNENMERALREKTKEHELYMSQGLQKQADMYKAQMDKLQEDKRNAEREMNIQVINMQQDQLKALTQRLAASEKKAEGGGCMLM